MCPRARRSGRVRGVTLVEVTLVLALLVVIAAVAIPAMGGVFARASLRGGCDTLRAAWSKARMAAIQKGQSFVFRCEPRGRRFQIIPLDQIGLPESDEQQPMDPDGERAPQDMLRIARMQLPDGVIFAKADVRSSTQLAATAGSTDGGAWSSPILFRPDGTTSDASMVIENEPGNTIRVTLRGLTGISTAGDVGREAVE
jgi:type II secretory pathway pseudopilin PulG